MPTEKVAELCAKYLIGSKQEPTPTNQESFQVLCLQVMKKATLAALTKCVVNPEGTFYDHEIVPFLQLVMDKAPSVIDKLHQECIDEIVKQRPEDTPPPSPNKVEDEDPIVKAKQGKSNIIIPGVND